jgi:ribosomal protein S18 acetylase RimI-like enzyme
MVKNAFKKRGRFFATASKMGMISGFLLFSFNESTFSSKIEFIVVDQEYKGQGIGRSLISSMEYYVGCRGMETIIVGTQLDNIDALKFYLSCGFSVLECNSVYHYWPLKSQAQSFET